MEAMMNHFTRVILGLSLMLTMSARGMDIQNSHSGSWWNASQSGHGLIVEVLDQDTLVVYWFVYSPTGEPAFLLLVADIDGSTASGPVYQYSGMRFGEFNPDTVNETVWGSMSIEFIDCDTARMSYTSDVIHASHAYGSGTIDLTRLTAIHGLHCFEGKQATTGYWEVTLSELSTGTDQSGTAIIDDGGLVTVELGREYLDHLIGKVSRPAPGEPWVLDGRLNYGDGSSLELSLVGTPTNDGFRFASDAIEVEFSYMPDRPNVVVSQAYLDGTWDGDMEVIDGEFSWDSWFIDVLIHNTLQMTIPSYGGNTIPFTITSRPWPNETFNGHAFYWRDDAAGTEHMELRYTWGDYLLTSWTMERPIPQAN
jgi:hypothetical protein